MVKQKYSFLKTLQKMGIVLAEVLIAGGLIYVTESPELIFLVPIFEGLRNYWKHKDKIYN
jgi:hypothetical protein